MLIRKGIICAVCVMLLIGFSGCRMEDASQVTQQPISAGVQKETLPNVCPPSVMINGKMYRDWSLQPLVEPKEIGEEEILGYITSIVSISTIPTKNDEANYPNALNAPYARWTHEEYGEVYVIKYGYGWHILLPEDYPIS